MSASTSYHRYTTPDSTGLRDRSETGWQCLSNRSCDEENESVWVCITCTRLDRPEICSIRCERLRNCPADATCSMSVGGPGSVLSHASSSSHWLQCRWRVRAENRLYFGFRGYLLAHVQVPVQGGDVFSHLPVVGYRPIAKSVGQLQTLTALRCCDGGSLQTFIFSIEFVDEHQFQKSAASTSPVMS